MKAFYEARMYDSYIKVWHNIYDDMRFIAHWHPEIEFIYIREGTLDVNVENEFVRASEGDLLVIDSGEIHYSSLNSRENSVEFLIFDPKLINSLFNGFSLKSALLTKDFLESVNLHRELLNLLTFVENEKQKKEIYYNELCATEIKKFCLLLQRKTQDMIDHNKTVKKREKLKSFQVLIDYLEENYSEEITLEVGAEMLNVSKSYFSTLFKEYTGSTFIKYLNSIRVEKAIIEIHQNQKNITEIALDNGFNTIRTFNRVFKDFTNYTPTDFMQLSRGKIDNLAYQVRKSAHTEVTHDFDNKTLIKKA